MDDMTELWPLLGDAQREELVRIARLFAYAAPQRPAWLTPRQVAEEYGVAESTVREAMRGGRLPFSLPRGMTNGRRARRSDVETWLGIC